MSIIFIITAFSTSYLRKANVHNCAQSTKQTTKVLTSLISKLPQWLLYRAPSGCSFNRLKVVSTRNSLLLNTTDKHLLIKIVQTGTKKSAINISKLQEKKAVEHCDLALLLQRNQ